MKRHKIRIFVHEMTTDLHHSTCRSAILRRLQFGCDLMLKRHSHYGFIKKAVVVSYGIELS